MGERKRAGETSPPYDGTTQVWRVDVANPTPLAITRHPGGIAAYDLSADGTRLFFIDPPGKRLAGEWTQLRTQFPSVSYSGGKSFYTRLFQFDLQDWRVSLIREVDGACSDVAVSPDGHKVALAWAPEDSVASTESSSNIRILDLTNGVLVTLADSLWRRPDRPYGTVEMPTWSPDSTMLALFVSRDGYNNELFVAVQNASGSFDALPVPSPPGTNFRDDADAAFRMQWLGPHDLAILCDDHARSRIFQAHNVGSAQAVTFDALTRHDEVVDWFSGSTAGTAISCIFSDPQQMWEVGVVDRGAARAVTAVNGYTASWKLPQVLIRKWTNKGTSVEGLLELPYGYDIGHPHPLPMIISLHGGPTGSAHCNLMYSYLGGVLFSSHGYALFTPNFRGSTGYGDKFITDLLGHQNDIEVGDILAGVDSLCKEGIATKARLGAVGASYGGTLVGFLIAGDHLQLKAASSLAGVTDYAMEWGASDEPAFDVTFMRGFPWSKPDHYRRASSIYLIGHAATPTIVHVGEKDRRCIPANSQMLVRALNTMGVPGELLVYPNEEHGLNGYRSRKAKMTWDIAWFTKYLP